MYCIEADKCGSMRVRLISPEKYITNPDTCVVVFVAAAGEAQAWYYLRPDGQHCPRRQPGEGQL